MFRRPSRKHWELHGRRLNPIGVVDQLNRFSLRRAEQTEIGYRTGGGLVQSLGILGDVAHGIDLVLSGMIGQISKHLLQPPDDDSVGTHFGVRFILRLYGAEAMEDDRKVLLSGARRSFEHRADL